jgi:hypothetical protein
MHRCPLCRRAGRLGGGGAGGARVRARLRVDLSGRGARARDQIQCRASLVGLSPQALIVQVERIRPAGDLFTSFSNCELAFELPWSSATDEDELPCSPFWLHELLRLQDLRMRFFPKVNS